MNSDRHVWDTESHYVTFVDSKGLTRTVPIDDDPDAAARISAKIEATAEKFRSLTKSPAV